MTITSTSKTGMGTWFSHRPPSSCLAVDRTGRVHHSNRIDRSLKSRNIIISLRPRTRLAMLTPSCRATRSRITGSSSTTLIRITIPYCPRYLSNQTDLSKRSRGQGIIARKARSPTAIVSIMALDGKVESAPRGTSSGTLLIINLILRRLLTTKTSWKGLRRRCLFLISLRRSKSSLKLNYSRCLLVMDRIMYQ